MNQQNDPMPLSQLPEYVRSLRESGSVGDGVVVDMGMIVDDERPKSWLRRSAYATAACLFLALGTLTYTFMASKSIKIVAAEGVGYQTIVDVVAEGGGRIVSMKKNDDNSYELRVLAPRRMGYLLEYLRAREDLERVETK
jgi:hypothetical protein